MDPIENLPEVFKNWSVAPEPPGGELAFALQGEPAQGASLWRMKLPGDPLVAEIQLAQAEAQVTAAEHALEEVPDRIDSFIQTIQTHEPEQVAFAVTEETGAPLAKPERELLRWLDNLEPTGVSYGLELLPISDFKEARQQFQQITEKLLRLLLHFAWVETELQGRLLARTAVNWSGDMDTAWATGTLADQYALHYRSLKLALASRITMLRMFIIVTQGAAKLSVLIATPGGALLALPAAWKFINNVFTELDRYQEIKQEVQEN